MKIEKGPIKKIAETSEVNKATRLEMINSEIKEQLNIAEMLQDDLINLLNKLSNGDIEVADAEFNGEEGDTSIINTLEFHLYRLKKVNIQNTIVIIKLKSII